MMIARMKKIFFIIFASISIANQAHAKDPDCLYYSGPLHSGTVWCYYYEDENEQRIYDGPFEFKYTYEGHDGTTDYTEDYTVKGTFTDDKRTDSWQWFHKGNCGATYCQFRKSIEIKYVNGTPIYYIFRTGTPHFESYLEYESTDGAVTKGTYSQGVLPNFDNNNGELSFSFNKEGKPEGEWIWKPEFDENSVSEPIQISQFYSNGVLSHIKSKNIATGEIIITDSVPSSNENITGELDLDKDFASQIPSDPAEMIRKFNGPVIERIGNPSPAIARLILP